jgi:hypothetical protein
MGSQGEMKRLSRAVFTARPMIADQHPLHWSHVPITFDVEDHPESTTGVVSPTINNIFIRNMLVDGGDGLNLISAKLIDKLQIAPEQLLPSSPFRQDFWRKLFTR